MDVNHPAIVESMQQDGVIRRSADSGRGNLQFTVLAVRASQVNKKLRAIIDDEDAVGTHLAQELLDNQFHFEAGRITREQLQRLKEILGEGLELDPPDEPVFAIPFPAKEHASS